MGAERQVIWTDKEINIKKFTTHIMLLMWSCYMSRPHSSTTRSPPSNCVLNWSYCHNFGHHLTHIILFSLTEVCIRGPECSQVICEFKTFHHCRGAPQRASSPQTGKRWICFDPVGCRTRWVISKILLISDFAEIRWDIHSHIYVCIS